MKMDYEKVTHRLGTFGTYQKRLMVLTLLPIIFNSFGTPISNFILGDHHHRCKIPDFPNDTYAVQNADHSYVINLSIPLNKEGGYDSCHLIKNGTLQKCSEWVFDYSVFSNTVISQFLLVCKNSLLRSHATSAYFLGNFLSFLAMPFTDVFGRRLMCCLGLTVEFIVNITEPFSTNIYMFIVLRFFDGFSGSIVYQIAFIIVLELVDISRRQQAGTHILMFYCFGEYILLLVGFFVRDWRWLQIAVAISMVFPMTYWWPPIFPESIRWLLSRGRQKEALIIIRRIAKVNQVKLDENIGELTTFEDDKDEGIRIILKKLFTSMKLLIRLAITCGNWMIVSTVYYGIQINIGKLSGDFYLNFLYNTIAENVGYVILYFANKTGRMPMYRVSMFTLMFISVALVFLNIFRDESLDWIIVSLAVLGKLLSSLAFGVIYMYTGEAFPTVVRGVVIAMSATCSRVGSLLSPYLYSIVTGDLNKAFPFIVYTVGVAVMASLSLLLPETTNKRLLEKVDDVNKMDLSGGTYADAGLISNGEEEKQTTTEI